MSAELASIVGRCGVLSYGARGTVELRLTYHCSSAELATLNCYTGCMPELPEVETVKRGLEVFLPGLIVADVTFDTPKSFPNSAQDVKQFLIGAQVGEVTRRGKALIIALSTHYSLFIHLKMTGQLVYVSKQNKQGNLSAHDSQLKTRDLSGELRFGAGHPNDSLIHALPDRTTRVTISFTNGADLFFNDQRKFGWVKLLPTEALQHEDFIKKLGPEPLEDGFTNTEFIQRIRRRLGTSIKAALLDQSVLAGVGNIYADESLWAAKIHPATLVKNVSDKALKVLHQELISVLLLSIEKGGSTDRNYVNAEGKKGSYISFAKVFRRDKHPCPRCNTTIIKIRVAGRGTHICPKCQVHVK